MTTAAQAPAPDGPVTSGETAEANALATVAQPRRKSRGISAVRHDFASHWQLWVMVLPALLFVGLFAYVPMYGIQLAFRKFVPSKGLTGADWVGFKYFEQFFTSPLFGTIMKNTISVSVWTLVFGFVGPIVLALLINQIAGANIKKFVQTITYMPHFISIVVIVSMINIFLRPDSGFIGKIANEDLLANPDMFVHIYWISEVWQHCGWNAIIYLAALSTVDMALYEAAKIDGAGRLRLIQYVDIPAILPTAAVLLILNMGHVLGVGFEKVYLMQNALNLSSTEMISTYTYKIGILSNQFSYSTAIGLFNTVINFVFLLVANQIAKKASGSGVF